LFVIVRRFHLLWCASATWYLQPFSTVATTGSWILGHHAYPTAVISDRQQERNQSKVTIAS